MGSGILLKEEVTEQKKKEEANKEEGSVRSERGPGSVKKQGRDAQCYTHGRVRYHSGVTMDDIIPNPWP